jgi:hypothetical protein
MNGGSIDKWSPVVAWGRKGIAEDSEAHGLVGLARGGPEMAVNGGHLAEEEAAGN